MTNELIEEILQSIGLEKINKDNENDEHISKQQKDLVYVS